ncbi:MAG: serine O-acetyltransferase EpsC [Verrucomicrobiota bacterium]|nr:serine O-acetyltransferase EpsC [Verrucomicrobiota bacterium]MEC8657628.1 serine O-acetyltransferase EpsC [Verrucomicrobiota bacterium]
MENVERKIVDDLLLSYQEVGGINRIDSANLPSRPGIASICEDLLQILFPGFLETEAIESENLDKDTSELLETIFFALNKEINRSLRLLGDEESQSKNSIELASNFLSELPKIRSLLRTDVEAAYEGDPAAQSFEEIILAYPSLEAIAVQRMAHVLYNLGIPLIPRMMTEWVHSKTGIDIHPGATIGSHFFIDHGTGVVIGETCEIGSHVKLYHGVTLGARSFQKDNAGNPIKGIKRHPNVEDYVVVYPGATILGGETVIGARSTIGANAFIMNSIDEDSLVALSDVEHEIKDKRIHKETLDHEGS